MRKKWIIASISLGLISTILLIWGPEYWREYQVKNEFRKSVTQGFSETSPLAFPKRHPGLIDTLNTLDKDRVIPVLLECMKEYQGDREERRKINASFLASIMIGAYIESQPSWERSRFIPQIEKIMKEGTDLEKSTLQSGLAGLNLGTQGR
jgi:hypothetical protein